MALCLYVSQVFIINQKTILSEDRIKAIKQLIDLVKRLILLMDQESHALAKQDAVSLAASEEEKIVVTQRYEQACEEFKARLQQFRGVPVQYIDQLESLQKELQEKAKDNVAMMDRLGMKPKEILVSPPEEKSKNTKK